MWWLWMDYFLFQHFANKENEIDFKEQLISKHKNCPSPYGARGFLEVYEYPEFRYPPRPGWVIQQK